MSTETRTSLEKEPRPELASQARLIVDIGGGPDMQPVQPPSSAKPYVTFGGFESSAVSPAEQAYQHNLATYGLAVADLAAVNRAREHPNERHVVIDPSLDTAAIAKTELPDNVTFIKAQADEKTYLPIAPGSVDEVSINHLFTPVVLKAFEEHGYTDEQALRHLGSHDLPWDIQRYFAIILGQAWRILKPGGVLTLRERSENMELIRALNLDIFFDRVDFSKLDLAPPSAYGRRALEAVKIFDAQGNAKLADEWSPQKLILRKKATAPDG